MRPAAVLVLTFATLQLASAQAKPVQIERFLVLPPLGKSGRTALQIDPLQQLLVTGRFKTPRAGDKPVAGADAAWKEVVANTEGWLQNDALQGGVAFAAPKTQGAVMILEALGHGMVYVDGIPRAGDPYAFGTVRTPIATKRGVTPLLFTVGRGRLNARLVAPIASVEFNAADTTLPDLIVGEPRSMLGAITILNATQTSQAGLRIVAKVANVAAETPLAELPPLGIRKARFEIPSVDATAQGDLPLELRIVDASGKTLVSQKLTIRARSPSQTRKVTFVSRIDGSVQEYAVNPCSDPSNKNPAIVLSLHGAGVQPINQADAYGAKSWAQIVCPSNRRQYGFDWEDWGQVDALEALADAQAKLPNALDRTYLTGHSMGGHGTWQLGVTFPDRFAAIAPSAGWVSFFSYGGASRKSNPDPIEAIFQRAQNPSDTLALVGNLANRGVYILHGGADDNVPVSEAQTMAAALRAFHDDWRIYVKPGAGHWWGNECVDWPPIFEMFARRRLPGDDELNALDFRTMNPGVSDKYAWVRVLQQTVPLALSRVTASRDFGESKFELSIENVEALSLRPRLTGKKGVAIDGQVLEIQGQAGQETTLIRSTGKWIQGQIPEEEKRPERTGPFKRAIGNDVLFVFPTGGDPELARLARIKAEYDAETFWYRGNASVQVVSDTACLKGRLDKGRNVILYGDSESNKAWRSMIDDEMSVRQNLVTLGGRRFSGRDLAAVFVRPKKGEPGSLVGVVAATSPIGMRLTFRMPFFLSGAAFPDAMIASPAMLSEGSKGVVAAGFFGNDWKTSSGTFAYSNR